jgi:hypothetical protein
LSHERDPIKVLYLLARGRTGSTIVARVLGEIPGFLAVGEIRSLWDPVAVSDGRCSCGDVLAGCPVWAPVLEVADRHEAASWQREIVRERNLPRLLRTDPEHVSRWPALDAYARVMGRVYQTLSEVNGARVVVDSSKRPSYGAVLRFVRGIRPFYVHLLRDPRASAFSWKHRRYESVTQGAEVTRRGPVDATLRWDLLNIEAELLRRAVPPERFLRLRLEDFVASPRSSLASILRLVHEPEEASPLVGERSVRLGASHAIGGNPTSRSPGMVEIRDSSEWRHTQSRTDRWLSVATALPLLRRYGYTLSGRPEARMEQTKHERG